MARKARLQITKDYVVFPALSGSAAAGAGAAQAARHGAGCESGLPADVRDQG